MYKAPEVIELGSVESFTKARRRGRRSDGLLNRRRGGGGPTS